MKYFLLVLTFVCAQVHAQFLPASKIPPKPLTEDMLQRWIKTNDSIREYQTVIDEMLPTDNEAKAFDQLSVVEQDRIVNQYLQKKGKFEPLNGKMKTLGWSGVADYMRASSQIGNAIAADLEAERVANMKPEEAKAILEKSDPAVKSVPKADLDFIRAHKELIRKHIQGYSAH